MSWWKFWKRDTPSGSIIVAPLSPRVRTGYVNAARRDLADYLTQNDANDLNSVEEADFLRGNATTTLKQNFVFQGCASCWSPHNRRWMKRNSFLHFSTDALTLTRTLLCVFVYPGVKSSIGFDSKDEMRPEPRKSSSKKRWLSGFSVLNNER